MIYIGQTPNWLVGALPTVFELFDVLHMCTKSVQVLRTRAADSLR